MDRKIVALFRLLAVAMVFVLSVQSAAAQTTTTGSGAWSSTTPDAPWPGGIIPPSTENITVGAGFTLTVDGAYTCNSISAGAGSIIINNSNLTVTTNLTGVGSLIQGTNATLSIGGTSTITTLTATANPNTVIFAGAGAQTIKATTYHHLTTSGGGTKTATITTVNGDLTIGDGTTFAANNTLLVTGTTTLGGGTSGIMTFANAGSKTFVGLVTINSGGNWNNSTEAITFRGGITNNGTFTAGTGLHTFNTNSQILSGALSFPSVTVSSAPNITVTNNGTLTVNGTLTIGAGDIVVNNLTATVVTALSGAGAITQGAGATLNIAGASAITTLTATASGNTVNYTGGAQTVHSNSYVNLGLSGSGAKTLQAGTTSIFGNFDLGGTATTTAVAALTIGGHVTLGSGTGFTAGAFTHSVGGNWTNNGTTFDGTGSTIVLDGAGQTIGGSSSTSFNTLTLSGSGTKLFGVSTAVTGTLSIGAGVVADLSTFTTHTANMLMLNGALQIAGTWGGTGSGATNINTTFFAANPGRLTVAVGDFTYYARNNGNWNSPSTWSTVGHGSSTNAGTFPGATNFAVIGGNFTVTVTANAACASLSFDAGTAVTNTLTINAGNTLTVSGAVTIPQTITSGANIMNVGAGNLVAGSVAFTSGSGGGTGHRMTISTGTATISGNVSGTGTSSTVQFTGAGMLQVGGSMFTSATGTLTTAVGSTVEYNGATQTIEALPYRNLTLSGSGNKTLAATTTISGNLLVGDNTTFTVGAVTLAVNGTTTIGSGASGILSITSATGTKTFTGLVTINTNGTWTNTTEAVTFQGGITNNGTFTAGTGVHTFNTNSQTLTGSFSIPNVTVTGGTVELTNTDDLTVSTALSGTGRIKQFDSESVLNIGGASTITTMTATAAGNTVNYTGGSQTVKNVNYANLGLSGGVKTMQVGTNTISGDLTLSSGAQVTGVVGLTIGGTVDIGSGTVFTAGPFTHNVGGNWTNNGTFDGTGSTINLSGTAQNISGGITTFNDLRLSGTGTKTFNVGVTIGNELSIDNGAIANLSNANTHTAVTLVLAGAAQASGNWGNTTFPPPPPTNTNDSFFSGTGYIAVSVGGTTYYSIADDDWSNPNTWSTTGFFGGAASQAPDAGDYVIIGNGRTVTVTGSEQCQELLFDAGISATNTLSITTGSLDVAGPITIPQNTGNTLSVGAGTLTGGSLDFTAGTGAHQLTINTGTVTISGNVTGIGTSSTVQFTGAGTLQVGGSMFTSTTGTLTTAVGSTVEYNGSAQTIQALPYRNLTVSGSGNKTLAATTTIGGNLVVGDNTTFVVGAVTLAVNGTTTVGGGSSGTIAFTSTTGTKTFTGLVTISANGTWNEAVNEAFTFQGGITNNGTFTAGTAAHTFNTNSQTLTGSFSIPNVTVTGGTVELTNTDDLTVSTALSGTGRIKQFDNESVLNIGGASTITTMTATAAGNTVNYTGGAQTVKNVNYANLGLSGGVKTMQVGTNTISGDLTLTSGAQVTAVIDLTIDGDVSIASGTELNTAGFDLLVGRDWINNGTFTPAGGEVTLTGTSQQISGSSPQSFYNLVLSGTGTKVFAVETNITDALSINLGAVADLESILDHTANRLILNGALQSNTGLWGSSSSSAPLANQNDTYFLNPSTGVINIAVGGFNLYSVADGNWSNTSTWSSSGFGGAPGAGPPTANDNVFIGRVGAGNRSVTVDGAAVCGSLVFDASTASVNNTVTIAPGNSLTVSGSITIPQAATATFSNTLAVGSGTLTAEDLTFTTTPSGAGHSMTISSGTATINGTISGIGATSTIQLTGAGLLRVSGTMFPSGSGTLSTFAGSTVEYNGAAQTVQALPYQNVILSGSGNKTLAANTTVGGNLSIGDGVTFTIGAFTFAVTGTTTIGEGTSGTLLINSAAGTKTFTGLVTIATNGTWSNTANELVTFRGGITNNGTFTAGTGAQTFDTNSQALAGANPFSIPNMTITGVTLTNNGTLTVNNALSGSGEIAQGSGGSAVLNIGFAGPPAITTMTATGTGNTVNYTAAAQTVRGIPYVNLGLSGSGVKTLTGVTTITGNITLSGTVSATAAANLTIGGALTIGSGTTFTAGAFNHAIGGNFVNNGTFNNSSRRITFTGGTATKTIQGTTPTTFYDLHIGEGTANPDVQVDQTVNLVGEMTFDANATFDADGSGNDQIFTIISTATEDGRIGPLSGTADVTGNVTVQRYMDNEGLLYRYISTPVANPTAEDLQGEIPITGPFTGSSFPPQTGCTNCAPCTGCVLNQQSMYVYDETIVDGINYRYTAFPASANSETMTPGRGYAVYIRNNTSPTIWDLRATLNKGEINLNPSRTSTNEGLNLVGNPYASPIDWESGAWTRSNIGTTIYIWDNSINNYASYTLGGGSTNGGSRYIASGQAFWVQATNTSPDLRAQEGIKANRAAIAQATFFLTAKQSDNLRVRLIGESSSDELLIRLNNQAATIGFDARIDSYEFPSDTLLSIHALTADKKRLAVNTLGIQSESTTEIQVGLLGTKPGQYKIDFSEFENFTNPTSVFLYDRFTETWFEVLPTDKVYSFTVTEDPASSGDNRLMMFLAPRGKDPIMVETDGLDLSAYPNPATDRLTIRMRTPDAASAGLLNTLGVPVIPETELLRSGMDRTGQFDLSGLPPGIYIVQVRSGRNMFNKRIVKQ